MAILASAPVPAASRLIDADTMPLPRPRHLSLVTADCPPWCRRDHSGEVTEYDGLSVGTLHERTLVELDASDPGWVNRLATAVVLVERSDEAGEVITPTRVVLNITEGPIPGISTPLVTQGWTGSPEQARALAAALLAAAELVEGGAR